MADSVGMDGFALIPQPAGSEGYVELSRTRTGKLFEKHILNYGPLIYPGVRGGRVQIDDSFVDQLIANFKSGVCDIVQVPLAGPKNEHTEDPNRNIGEVVGLTKRGKKLYAQIDVRDSEAAPKMGKTLLGASAMLHLNYTDTRTGLKSGPTLLHVVVTNRPYVVGLGDFEELIAATALGAKAADGNSDAVVLTAPTMEDKMTLDDLLAELRADHGIDVPALQERAAAVDGAVALTNAITEVLGAQGLIALSNADVQTEDLIGAVRGAGEQIISLTSEVTGMREAATRKAAEDHVDTLVRSGHILPKSRKAQVELLLSNPTLFDDLLPETPLIKLSNEEGFGDTEAPSTAVLSEVERITASVAASQYIKP